MSYNTVPVANAYFETRLNMPAWETAVSANKTKALTMAYKIIENLSHLGKKNDPDQANEYPRLEDTTVPDQILEAEALIAVALLDDRDIELERDNLSMVIHKFGNITTTYDRSELPLHILAGIPSYEAWLLLKPFLRDIQNITLSRV